MKLDPSNLVFTKNRWLAFTIVLTVSTLFSGCGKSVEDSLWQQIKTLQEEKTALTLENEKLRRENQQCNQQVATLQGLGDRRTGAMDTIRKIEIGSRSGFFDKDKNGTKETLIVYVRPLDSVQDSVKAVGEISVALWRLEADQSQGGLLKQWHISSDELQKLWAGTLANSCYRVSFPAEDVIRDGTRNLTVKVQFIDYGSGKTLDAQLAVP